MDKIEVAGKLNNASVDNGTLDVGELDVFAQNLQNVEWGKLKPDQQKSLRDLHTAIEKRLAALEKSTLEPKTKHSLENLFNKIVATLKRKWIPSESKLAESFKNETVKGIVKATSETTAATVGRVEQFTEDYPKTALGIVGGVTYMLLRGWKKSKEVGKKGYEKAKSAGGTAWGYFKKALLWAAGILGGIGAWEYIAKPLLEKNKNKPNP
ncbi:hypothetical protein HY213_00585 [Candidatus Peregrinibacteria bacterium]|nr:hypothetical protein [Candidatus Peregrinibacteria bacterium]